MTLTFQTYLLRKFQGLTHDSAGSPVHKQVCLFMSTKNVQEFTTVHAKTCKGLPLGVRVRVARCMGGLV